MKNFDYLKKLIGEPLEEEDLKFVDSYFTKEFGLFIPVGGHCGYAKRKGHSHPSYSFGIFFEKQAKQNNYFCANVISPGYCHNDENNIHYYALCIDKDYFEKRYLMYADSIPKFEEKEFEICSDILKYLNMFAFEYSKEMMNSEITLGAHVELITHWLIRSILGESLDMRAISSDYSVARAQHYIEQHYSENITIAKLAGFGYVSPSGLNHKFKAELGVSPIEYLIEIRIQRAKTMLQRRINSITEIAMRCGFSSTAHFSTTFQKRTGITPSEYQQKYL